MKVEGKIVFKFDKDTKNCYRFKEVAEGRAPVVGTLYVQKWAFNAVPKELTVTIHETAATSGGGASV